MPTTYCPKCGQSRFFLDEQADTTGLCSRCGTTYRMRESSGDAVLPSLMVGAAVMSFFLLVGGAFGFAPNVPFFLKIPLIVTVFAGLYVAGGTSVSVAFQRVSFFDVFVYWPMALGCMGLVAFFFICVVGGTFRAMG